MGGDVVRAKHWLAVILLVLISVNFFLTYLLLNRADLINLYSNFQKPQERTQETTHRVFESHYFKPAKPQLLDVLEANQVIYRNQEGYFHINQVQIHKEITSVFDHPIIELEDNQVQIDPVFLGARMENESIQFIYLDKISVSLLAPLIDIPEKLTSNFELNRILFSKDEEGSVYLVDSVTKSYIKGKLTEGVTFQSIQNLIKEDKYAYIPMQEHYINRDTVYLPKQSLASPSQVFVLEKVPEPAFLYPVFGEETFDITEPDSNKTRSYHTLTSYMMINDASNIMTISNNSQQSVNSLNEKSQSLSQEHWIRKSVDFLQEYVYWNQGLRYYGSTENQVVYRRYLGGMPIFSPSNLPDYGVTKIGISNLNHQAEMNRLQMPLMILDVHVTDQSDNVVLESGNEIEKILEEQGLAFSQFSKILLAFEWQAEMENFKKVTLIPKWYFVANSQNYSMDQIKDGTAKKELAKQS